MAASTPAAAWYGKLPSLGDFASRRLGADFIEAWDAWLAQGLADWRSTEPDWLQAYLAAPSWRFLLASRSVHGRSPWLAGVLMPSVDAAGRYFPLTLLHPLVEPPATPATAQPLLAWLHRLNDLALDALHEDWSVPTLEDALARLGSTELSPAGPAETPAPLCAPLVAQARAGRSLWWCADAQGATRALACRALPTGADFRDLLAGRLEQLAASADVLTLPLNPLQEPTS